MKIKKILMSCLLLAGVLSASAQEQYPKTVYDHNPYWYVQLQGGAQYTLGEINFKDLVSPNVQVSLGRQITPVFGARLSVNAWESRAGIDDANGSAKWKWKYVAPGLDATFNLSNLFCGYNPTRPFNFSVFAGLGANIAWDNKKNDILAAAAAIYPTVKGNAQNVAYVWDGTKVRLFGRAGIAADYRLTESVSLGLELNANTLSDHYNSKRAGNWDWYFNALAGVKIDLGNRYSTRTIEAPKVPERVIEKVIERVIEKPVPQAVETPKPAAAAEDEFVAPSGFRRDIFYSKPGVHQIPKEEMQKVKEVADYMKANPTTTVTITGYADKGTGNAKINEAISQRRARAVRSALIMNYKINAKRIKVVSKGDTEQPYAKDTNKEINSNRVAIAIVE